MSEASALGLAWLQQCVTCQGATESISVTSDVSMDFRIVKYLISLLLLICFGLNTCYLPSN